MPRIMKIFGRKQAGQDAQPSPPLDVPTFNGLKEGPSFFDPLIASSTSDREQIDIGAADPADTSKTVSDPANALEPDRVSDASIADPLAASAQGDRQGVAAGDPDIVVPSPPSEAVAQTLDPAVGSVPLDVPDVLDSGAGPATPPAAPAPVDVPMSLHVDAHPIAESPAPAIPVEPHPSHASPFAARTTSALSAKIGGVAAEHEPAPPSEPNPAPQPEPPISSMYRGRMPDFPTAENVPSSTPSKTLIGGREADIVPLIPDTRVEVESQELDDEAVASATVEALRGACDLMVMRVNKIQTLQDGGQIITALIALVLELDARYADDWGIVRRNGVREVLDQIYDAIAEGDRFILESLENGRGGLTSEEFVRDLRTVAESDRPRIVTEYSNFLVFVIRGVLRQYLRPLDNDQMRLRDVSRRLDFLIDGVREVLSTRINRGIRAG
jgi:hypothetical protein